MFRPLEIKIFFLAVLFISIFLPWQNLYAAQGGCVCNNATACSSQPFSAGTMAAVSTRCTNYCTTECSGGGVSEFTPYWPCTCCDGTNSFTIGSSTYTELSETVCRGQCTSHGGTAQAGDPSIAFASDCPSVPVSRAPGCYCDGTLVEMICADEGDCRVRCPLATTATCVPGYVPPALLDPGCYCDGTLARAMSCATTADCASICGTRTPSCSPGYSEPSVTPGSVTLPTGTPPPTVHLENPLGGDSGETSVPRIIGNIVKTILAVVGALALGMFVYGGFTWLTSGGSADKIQKGKDILMWAVIGLVVIFSSYTLVDFLLKAFGL